MTKISIVVPVYNSEKYLPKCLESLTDQTFKDIEIIMVNDGSTDDSEKIIKDFQKKDSRIKLFSKENGGQASARNFGLSKAKGEYISFIDSDDYVELDMFEKLIMLVKEKEYDIVVFDYFITCNHNDTYKKILNDNKSGEVSAKEYFFGEVCPWNKIYKREFLLNNNFLFPEGIIYEDYAIIPTLCKYNPAVYYINEAFVHYVHTDTSTMRSGKYKTKYEDIFKANEILYNELKDTDFLEELENLICHHMLYLGSLNFYKYGKLEQIDKISNFIKKYFPHWRKNKYVKEMTMKEKVLMWLFYRKRYKLIKLVQKIKKVGTDYE